MWLCLLLGKIGINYNLNYKKKKILKAGLKKKENRMKSWITSAMISIPFKATFFRIQPNWFTYCNKLGQWCQILYDALWKWGKFYEICEQRLTLGTLKYLACGNTVETQVWVLWLEYQSRNIAYCYTFQVAVQCIKLVW